MGEKIKKFFKEYQSEILLGVFSGMLGGVIAIQRNDLKRGNNIVTANRKLYADGVECIEVHLKSGYNRSYHRQPEA